MEEYSVKKTEFSKNELENCSGDDIENYCKVGGSSGAAVSRGESRANSPLGKNNDNNNNNSNNGNNCYHNNNNNTNKNDNSNNNNTNNNSNNNSNNSSTNNINNTNNNNNISSGDNTFSPLGNQRETSKSEFAWLSPIRSTKIEEVEDKQNLRILLHKSIDLNEDFPSYLSKALSDAKVDTMVGINNDVIFESNGMGSASARLPHSARSNGMKESARSFIGRPLDSSRGIMGGSGNGGSANAVLNNHISVECQTKDVDIDVTCDDNQSNNMDTFNSTRPVTSVSYDINGRSYTPSLFDIQTENNSHNTHPKNTKKKVPKKINRGGFSAHFVEGSLVIDLFESLSNSIATCFQFSRKSDDGGHERDSVSSQDNVPENNFSINREFTVIITVTGKWCADLTVTLPPKKPDIPSTSGSPRFKSLNSSPTAKDENYVQGEKEIENELEEEIEKEKEKEKEGCINSGDIKCVDNDNIPSVKSVPVMSLRNLLRSGREFSVNEQGHNYLYSHKRKIEKKVMNSLAVSEHRLRLDEKRISYHAKRRKVTLSFCITSQDDTFHLCEMVRINISHLTHCISKPYQI